MRCSITRERPIRTSISFLSTTKVLTEFEDLRRELARDAFSYVVPDFRLNKAFDRLSGLSAAEKDKVEFLCNECCWFGCRERKRYEAVSRKTSGRMGRSIAARAGGGRRLSLFPSDDQSGVYRRGHIQNVYLPMGFSPFQIEGRGLGAR